MFHGIYYCRLSLHQEQRKVSYFWLMNPFKIYVSHLCMLSYIRPNLVSVMYMVLRQSIRISMVTAFFVYLNGILAFQILIIPRLLHPHQITTRQAREDQKLVLKSRQLSKWTNTIKVSFFLNARLLDVDVFGCSIFYIYMFFLFVQFIESVVYGGDKWRLDDDDDTQAKIFKIAKERYRGWRADFSATYKTYKHDREAVIRNKPQELNMDAWYDVISYFESDDFKVDDPNFHLVIWFVFISI